MGYFTVNFDFDLMTFITFCIRSEIKTETDKKRLHNSETLKRRNTDFTLKIVMQMLVNKLHGQIFSLQLSSTDFKNFHIIIIKEICCGVKKKLEATTKVCQPKAYMKSRRKLTKTDTPS